MTQHMPTSVTTWEDSVHARLIDDLKLPSEITDEILGRALIGHKTYGTYLGVGNPGRDPVQDLRDQLLDSLIYAWERLLATEDNTYRAIAGHLLMALELMDQPME